MNVQEYKLITAALAAARAGDDKDADVWDAGYNKGVRDTAYRLSRSFMEHDPKFDRVAFLQACGLKVTP